MREIEKNLNGQGMQIGIVLSRFNSNIGDGLLSACTTELLRLGVDSNDITIATIPGALEAPLILQRMAWSENYDALIALGAIIRGETYHFEVVSNESARGIVEVQFNSGIPVANAILTTEDDDQAIARMHIKGTEAAQVAVEMYNLIQAL
ncbi:6,7-dimethyl-8-ribityllumazine synthase [Methylotenera sp. G11]|uniref:6,7-dimethyl-8-ribityllumazine synthase n=1 Tax=Methylotenera sp. G11 TaxID=1506585 RepID=UPI000647B84F|nr:6,7-dimethyl-8-ribityllumazine synthase [Methylotenera sp. G11]